MITVIFEDFFRTTTSSFQDFIRKNEDLILIELKTEEKERKSISGKLGNETVITATFIEKELEEEDEYE
jgi:hypothetical protein